MTVTEYLIPTDTELTQLRRSFVDSNSLSRFAGKVQLAHPHGRITQFVTVDNNNNN